VSLRSFAATYLMRVISLISFGIFAKRRICSRLFPGHLPMKSGSSGMIWIENSLGSGECT